MLLPLEWSLAQALGLPGWALWAPSAAIEGYALLAVLGGHGRDVAGALALTWCSALVGLAHSASERARVEGRALSTLDAAAVVVLVTLVAGALLGVHRALERSRRAEQGRRERADQDRRAQDEQERANRALERADRAARARLEAETARELARTRAYAETERARLEAEMERARIAAGSRQSAPRADGADEVARRRARDQWEQAERAGTPMTGRQLGTLLGVSEQQARKIAGRWRDERAQKLEAAR